MAVRLVKAKSHEVLDGTVNADSAANGFTSRMKKVFNSPILKKKRTLSLQLLNPSSDVTSKCFGIPLADLLVTKTKKTHHKSSLPSRSSLDYVPNVVKKIVQHVEEHGLDQQGIYRINGNTKLLEQLRADFNSHGDASLEAVDIYSVGSLLKMFLRQLPVSLVPETVIEDIIELQERIKGPYTTEHILQIKKLLAPLPEEHYQLLKYLCVHLSLVAECSESNKMTPVSLSIVFGPNVLRCGGELKDIRKQGFANAAFAQIMQNHQVIFDRDEELQRLKSISEISDNALTSTPIKKKKKRPEIPLPYREHRGQKEGSSSSLPSTPVCEDCFDLQSPNERSIDEAIEEATTATEVDKERKLGGTFKMTKSMSASDDLLINKASPYSWKSSGTNTSTSSVNSPGTAQEYVSLIGDTVQDHLFNSQLTSTLQTSPKILTSGDVPILQPLQDEDDDNEESESKQKGTSSNCEVVQLRETNFKRSSKTLRNRKGIIVGNAGLIQGGQQQQDLMAELKQRIQTSPTTDDPLNEEDKMSVLIDLVEEIDKDCNEIAEKDKLKSTGVDTSSKPQEAVPVPPGGTECTTHDFDYVTRKVETLMHPTLRRAKGPKNRTKPSSYIRRSLSDSGAEELTDSEMNMTVSQRKRDRSNNNQEAINKEIVTTPTVENKLSDKNVSVSSGVPTPSKGPPTSVPSVSGRVPTPSKGPPTSVPSVSGGVPTPSKGPPTSVPSVSGGVPTPSKGPPTSVPSVSGGVPTPSKGPPTSVPSVSGGVPTPSKGPPTSVPSVSGGVPTPSKGPPTSVPSVSGGVPTPSKGPPTSVPSVSGGVSDLVPSTVSIPSKGPSSISVSSPSLATSVKRNEQQFPIPSLQVAPAEHTTRSTIASGWIVNEEDKQTTYKDLIQKAKSLKSLIKHFEEEFIANNGHKPTKEENFPIAIEMASLRDIKKQIRALRSAKPTLNKTAPPTVNDENKKDSIDYGGSTIALVNENRVVEEDKRKRRGTVRRHQSLLLPSKVTSHYQRGYDSVSCILSMKRQEAGRPEKLTLMSFNQLVEEKRCLQKVLMDFEKSYGRPQTSEGRSIMRPIYDHYRNVKKLLTTYEDRHKSMRNKSVNSMLKENSLFSVTVLQSSPNDMLKATHDDNNKDLVKSSSTQMTESLIPKPPQSLIPKPGTMLLPTVPIDDDRTPIICDSQPPRIIENWMSDDKLVTATKNELQEQLALTNIRRTELKKELHKFETEFATKHKRPINKEERNLRYNDYIEYKKLKSRQSQIENLMET